MCNENQKRSWWQKWGGLLLLLVLITLVCAGAWGYCYMYLEREKAFEWTDPVGVWFSGLAFAGVIYAIFLQRQELELQRKELRDTREVFEGQRDLMQNQVEVMSRQNTQNAFFQVLDAQERVIERIRYTDPRSQTPRYGDEALERIRRALKHQVELAGDLPGSRSLIAEKLEETVYTEIANPYLAVLQNTLTFIDRGAHDERQKEDLATLLTGFLTQDRLYVACVYGITEEANGNLKPLLEKYMILRNLNTEDIPSCILDEYESLRQV